MHQPATTYKQLIRKKKLASLSMFKRSFGMLPNDILHVIAEQLSYVDRIAFLYALFDSNLLHMHQRGFLNIAVRATAYIDLMDKLWKMCNTALIFVRYMFNDHIEIVHDWGSFCPHSPSVLCKISWQSLEPSYETNTESCERALSQLMKDKRTTMRLSAHAVIKGFSKNVYSTLPLYVDVLNINVPISAMMALT